MNVGGAGRNVGLVRHSGSAGPDTRAGLDQHRCGLDDLSMPSAHPLDRELDANEMLALLRDVGLRLAARNVHGEILLAGGAVMVLVVASRPSSVDVDVRYLTEREAIMAAVKAVAIDRDLSPRWLNDAVADFLPVDAPASVLYELVGPTVRAVTLEFMVRMKAWAGGPQDVADLRALVQKLGLTDSEQVLRIVEQHSPGSAGESLPRDMQIMIEGLFD